jgi:5-formyltetrahydrofolate cyclo-ligase
LIQDPEDERHPVSGASRGFIVLPGVFFNDHGARLSNLLILPA